MLMNLFETSCFFRETSESTSMETLFDLSVECRYQGIEGLLRLYEKYRDRLEIAKTLLSDRFLRLYALTLRFDLTIQEFQKEYLETIKPVGAFLRGMGSDTVFIETGRRDIIESVRHDFQTAASAIDEIGKKMLDYDLYTCFVPQVGQRVIYEDEIDRFMNLIDTETVFLCVDTAHLVYSGQDPAVILKTYGGCVKNIWLSDLDRHPEPSLATQPPQPDCWRDLGQGVTDFASIFQTLHDLDYNRWLTVVCYENEIPRQRSYLQNAHRFLQPWITEGNNP